MSDKKLAQLDILTPVSGDDKIYATNAAGTKQGYTTRDEIANQSRPYKVYSALISQSSTSAPTAVVLENTLGGTVTFARDLAGQYRAILVGAFPVDKTFLSIALPVSGFLSYAARQDNNTLDIESRVTATNNGIDDILNKTPFEIRVYN